MPGQDVSLGERVAYYRRRRGLSQVVAAQLMGRSEEWLSQVERGARALDRLSVIVQLAGVLGVEPVKLLGKPFLDSMPARTARRTTVPDHMPAIRRALTRYEAIDRLLDGSRREQPPDLADLRRRIAQAKGYSQTERWSALAPITPGLLDDAHAAVRMYDGRRRQAAYGLLALAYHVTSGMLDRVGEVDLPWIAAERAMAAADRADDPLLGPVCAWRLAVVLRHAGRIEESRDVPLAAADALRSSLPDAGPARDSVYGALLLKGAVGASTLADATGVRDLMREADSVAARTGDRNDYWFAFGPTNLAIHRVWLAVEMDDPIDALIRSEDVRLEELPPALAERRSSHLITIAWAYHLRRRDDDALNTLREVREVAPEQLLFTGRVREMLRLMLKKERRSIRADLREMADFVGVLN